MKRKKVICALFAMTVLTLTTITVSAATKSWSYSNYSHGGYVPKSGSMTSSYKSGTAYTKTTFLLDSTNVTKIEEYNNGTNSSYQGTKGYLTVDISSIRTGNEDKMDAYAIVSNLPDPKYDLENDDTFGTRNEESEAVALGTVKAQEYYVKTSWDDLREGNDDDRGSWQCQFSMSKKGISDYNTFVQSDVIQATISYGKTAGQD